MTMSNVLIGSDVEYWKADTTPLDVYELALKEIGSKSQPSIGPYGPYHSDQVWAERATRPCASLSELLDDLIEGQIWLESTMGMTLQGVNYIEQEFDEFEHPFLFRQAREFGCSPDMVNGMYRRVPRGIKERSLREAGAHIHFNLPRAYTDTLYHTRGQWMAHGNMMQRFVRQVQEALGPYHTWDHELQPWYRKPGTYRLKPYGVEYRSIGAGILSNPDLMIGAYSAAFDLLTDVWKGHAE